MTGAGPAVQCEGRCGVTVTGMDEVASDGLFVARHTPTRCRIIRTFREAAQRCMPRATATIAASSDRQIIVRVVGTVCTREQPIGETRMAQTAVDVLTATRFPIDVLGRVADDEAERLKRVLVDAPRGEPTSPDWRPEPVLARDPYATR